LLLLMRVSSRLFLPFFAMLIAGQAVADDTKNAARFQVLRSDKVNVRAGPATSYPIDWVFTKKGMPVEIVASFDTWRKIRDVEGTEGWVHQGMLAGRRAVIVQGREPKPLRTAAQTGAAPVATLEPGVIGRLLRCDPVWCEVRVDSYRGWMTHEELWGVGPGEVVQ
jgi:SH3-like domain-containing protein